LSEDKTVKKQTVERSLDVQETLEKMIVQVKPAGPEPPTPEPQKQTTKVAKDS